VPPLAVVGGNPARVLKFRTKEHYERLIREGKYGGVSGRLVLKSGRNDVG
jgi:acetyltransferase-like isoleucine patch superfamily enzyme